MTTEPGRAARAEIAGARTTDVERNNCTLAMQCRVRV
mgnify:CR=1 FL=1